ncbi:MAG: HIT domain-containing protein [Dongiaceae bacterium]
MTDGFTLHERLAADTIELTRWPLSLVLLINDRHWPWLILVPRRAGLREIHELDAADRGVLIEEIARASRGLDMAFRPAKINVAALGNMVPQLHVHVIARFADDPAWPRPVWGTVPPKPYAAVELAVRRDDLRRTFDATR